MFEKVLHGPDLQLTNLIPQYGRHSCEIGYTSTSTNPKLIDKT